MKTKNIFISFLLGATLFSSGCTDGFDALNSDPNNPDDSRYDFSYSDIAASIRNIATYGGADVHQRAKALSIDVYAQYTGGSGTSRTYAMNDEWQAKYWNSYYNTWLTTLNIVIKNSAQYEGRDNSIAIARIWRVYGQAQFTDYFGPAPFPFSPDDENPDYMPLDKQYELYFKELDEAVKQFDPKLKFMSGEDQIYWGDMAAWKRFANTLRLRLALKLSEIDEEACKSQIQAALAADGGIMTAKDNAAIAGTTGWGNQYPYYLYQVGWGEKQVLVKSMEKALTNIGGIALKYTDKEGNPVLDSKGKVITPTGPAKIDPRGLRMFDPGPADFGYKWAGLIAGQQTEDGDARNNVGKMSQIFVIPNDSRKTDIFLYSEVCFIMAEIAERFGINGGKSAKEWYEEGVKQSFLKWGLVDENGALDTNLVNAYLESTDKNSWGTSAKYDDVVGAGNTELEKIITQKYIASYPDMSLQIWNDKRRLNLPALDIPQYRNEGYGTYPGGGDIYNPLNYIQRTVYPQNEKLINESKYNAGVAQLEGGDKTSAPLWWASKKSNYCTSAK
ncbi:SusD/RagB family nutrient-binding outer membrane lipoprotein [Dysgonomonas sp. Marseille-P4677]|uniref:SusD/RagB family nutrient-binding outer membrane lipoprotein n=1 Tax=Dysgonomonas sp. Marseille-P4677 TaxID=2364790 RepID=UPI0019131DBA|nr:SusD/RagB family nutrient-binding outer membrane lipoprotein [Dysgonomonas sp. Marseille-P4677]MBK5719963.1 SusD/RagB family nutrient-binding outer membrane lipoprotein [Dysgonomonas sp. Marseille-P4677]